MSKINEELEKRKDGLEKSRWSHILCLFLTPILMGVGMYCLKRYVVPRYYGVQYSGIWNTLYHPVREIREQMAMITTSPVLIGLWLLIFILWHLNKIEKKYTGWVQENLDRLHEERQQVLDEEEARQKKEEERLLRESLVLRWAIVFRPRRGQG